jgi:hypothetical protein
MVAKNTGVNRLVTQVWRTCSEWPRMWGSPPSASPTRKPPNTTCAPMISAAHAPSSATTMIIDSARELGDTVLACSAPPSQRVASGRSDGKHEAADRQAERDHDAVAFARAGDAHRADQRAEAGPDDVVDDGGRQYDRADLGLEQVEIDQGARDHRQRRDRERDPQERRVEPALGGVDKIAVGQQQAEAVAEEERQAAPSRDLNAMVRLERRDRVSISRPASSSRSTTATVL